MGRRYYADPTADRAIAHVMKQVKKDLPKKTEAKKEPVKTKKAFVQQEETGDVKENGVTGEAAPVEDESRADETPEEREMPDVREVPADTEPDEQHCKMPVPKQSQQEMLEKRKHEVTNNTYVLIASLTEEIRNGCWNTAKMYLSDIREDIERIEKIDGEIADLHDPLQMRLEDYEQEE